MTAMTAGRCCRQPARASRRSWGSSSRSTFRTLRRRGRSPCASRSAGTTGRRAAGWGAVGGLLGTAGTAAFLLASHSADLAVTGVLASLYPAVTVLLAAAVLRERFQLSQGLGLLVCCASVGLVAVG